MRALAAGCRVGFMPDEHLPGLAVTGEKPSIAVGTVIQLSPLSGHAFLRSIIRSSFRSPSSLSDLTVWRNFQLTKCDRLKYKFNFVSKIACLFHFLTRFPLSP